MNRRLVLAGITVGIVAGGLAAPALADTSTRHYVCVAFPGSNPTDPQAGGICLNWHDPIAPPQ